MNPFSTFYSFVETQLARSLAGSVSDRWRAGPGKRVSTLVAALQTL